MEYVASVKQDKWTSSDNSDQDEQKNQVTRRSSSSSFRRKPSVKEQLGRSLSLSLNDGKRGNKSKSMETEHPSAVGKFAEIIETEKDDTFRNENGKIKSEEDNNDTFDEVDVELSDEHSPKLKRSITSASSNDPSSWRRSAVRIRRKANSYASRDKPFQTPDARRKAKMSLCDPVSFDFDTHEKRKMSLQVPKADYSSHSPMSESPPSHHSFDATETYSVNGGITTARPVSPSYLPPSGQHADTKKDRLKKKYRRVSSILKPVFEYDRMASLVEKAAEKSKPFLESEVGSYLVEKVDKVIIQNV